MERYITKGKKESQKVKEMEGYNLFPPRDQSRRGCGLYALYSTMQIALCYSLFSTTLLCERNVFVGFLLYNKSPAVFLLNATMMALSHTDVLCNNNSIVSYFSIRDVALVQFVLNQCQSFQLHIYEITDAVIVAPRKIQNDATIA